MTDADVPADAVLDDPLDDRFIEAIRGAVGPEIEDPGMAYTWAKRGVHRLVRREAVAFGRLGARICSVTPGIIDTPMGQQEAAARPTNEMLVQLSPLGREGTAEEVAAAVAFLLSDEAAFVTGIDLPVDGGVAARPGFIFLVLDDLGATDPGDPRWRELREFLAGKSVDAVTRDLPPVNARGAIAQAAGGDGD